MKLIKWLVLFSGISLLWGCSYNMNQSSQSSAIVKEHQINYNQPRDIAYFPAYINALKQYAAKNGINEQTINIAFKDVHYIEHVVKADRNQPEKKITLSEYLSRAVSPDRVKLAKQKYLAFHSQLSDATRLTHIPQNYILALWGVESGYGKYQGKEDVISALSTLSFDGRREQFFTKELISALMILQNGHIQKDQFKGSWAGAMGQNQFMPSSYLAYGLDGDGDGIVDIWNNMSDIFASTANYLATVGWNSTEGWGNKIQLPDNFNIEDAGLEPEKSKEISQWMQKGIEFVDNSHLIPKKTTKAWVIIPDSGSNQGYLVYNNFRTLMHWNRSYFFAISVGMLADTLTIDSLNTDEGSK